eukprot:4604394-Pleurochrysis_carterae.AAC.5
MLHAYFVSIGMLEGRAWNDILEMVRARSSRMVLQIRAWVIAYEIDCRCGGSRCKGRDTRVPTWLSLGLESNGGESPSRSSSFGVDRAESQIPCSGRLLVRTCGFSTAIDDRL